MTRTPLIGKSSGRDHCGEGESRVKEFARKRFPGP
jgi:hypothetical protein